MTDILWRPSQARIDQDNLTLFMNAANERWGLALGSYSELHQWSIDEMENFWLTLWDFANIKSSTGPDPDRVIIDKDKMPGARFFPDARLNFAENLLSRRDDTDAMVFWGEDQVKQHISWNKLYDRVSQLQQALKAAGVGAGDRVAGFMPNMPETVMAMLATASLGAVWSSCSPDFGIKGVMDRFGQIEPTVLFAAEGYFYNGKSHDCLEKLKGITAQLPGLKKLVIVSYTRERPEISEIDARAVHFADFADAYQPADIDYTQMPFNAPLYIMYSSGTTGMPKCIVHGIGGTLLKHIEEHVLQSNVRSGDRIFYFTTCGWMMWNWLVSGLQAGATICLFDGSPFYPSGEVLFDYIDAEKIQNFGTSAKFIDALNKGDLDLMKSHDLGSVRLIQSTGSPLAPQSFDYIYDKVKKDVCLSSMSGGTDLIGSFICGAGIVPVRRGELQCRGLGMAVEVFDDDGNSVVGESGELVCTKAFPSMPIEFWRDEGGVKYHNSYFAKYPNIWCHGDFVELTENGGMVVSGRSDAVLNPGGVRIGTAEIYRQVEKMEEVTEGIVIGQDWDNDVRVVLFVTLRDGISLDEALTKKIKAQIRANATPRHVPAKVIQVTDIPRTLSGKIVELAVRNIVHGRAVKNQDALANPEALKLYENLAQLAD